MPTSCKIKVPFTFCFSQVSLFIFLIVFNVNLCHAQAKRMVAMGSSTTIGNGATSPDSSWYGRFKKFYSCRMEIMDSCYNFGVGGAGVYAGMPSSYIPPSGRPSPNTYKNVTRSLTTLQTIANPADGVIIVNYPSNNYDTYSIAEVMDCLQTIYDSATRLGNKCFITTTQPRADQPFNTSAIKKKLADIKDSTINRFGDAHTINFWDGLFNPADSSILPMYSAGDQIHFNDAGHRVLFERVLAKNVFSFPVWYAAPNGALNQLSSWGANPDGSGANPVSFEGDNQVFKVVNNLNATINANWTISGKNVQVIVGDGISPVTLNIPAEFKITLSNPVIPSCH